MTPSCRRWRCAGWSASCEPAEAPAGYSVLAIVGRAVSVSVRVGPGARSAGAVAAAVAAATRPVPASARPLGLAARPALARGARAAGVVAVPATLRLALRGRGGGWLVGRSCRLVGLHRRDR